MHRVFAEHRQRQGREIPVAVVKGDRRDLAGLGVAKLVHGLSERHHAAP
jgi:hypothetical protein